MSNPYANCPVGTYHYFKILASPSLPGSQDVRQVEQCTYCKERVAYDTRPDGDVVDQRKYFNDHVRAFAQPGLGDPYLSEVYFDCNPGMREKMAAEAAVAAKQVVHEADRNARFEHAIKKALENKGENER